MDDDVMFGSDMENLPQIRAGHMLEDMHLDMPGMPVVCSDCRTLT